MCSEAVLHFDIASTNLHNPLSSRQAIKKSTRAGRENIAFLCTVPLLGISWFLGFLAVFPPLMIFSLVAKARSWAFS
jgi:hypothetical protein